MCDMLIFVDADDVQGTHYLFCFVDINVCLNGNIPQVLHFICLAYGCFTMELFFSCT